MSARPPNCARPLRIVLASPRGFCAGVDRAIEIVERALDRFGAPVYVRHEIVHNQHVVDDLRAKGAVFVDEPDDAPRGAHMIYSAHGVSPAVRDRAAANDLAAIDATCPLVTKVHNEVKRMVAEGYEIVMIGHAGHVEVEGTMGQAPDRMVLVETVEDVDRLEVANPDRLGCVTQTTLSVDDTREIMDALARRFPTIALPKRDDICYATQNRQDAVKELARRAELVLVVGAPSSSNSNRLVEVAAKRGARSHRIQDADEIDPAWLDGVQCVGITAGASSPEFLVQQVVRRLAELVGECEIGSLDHVDEGVTFKIPPELRAE
ncbi:MAG: 4-hydroxy-3-methylbut-2-enyl diphosphate reductase [Myxococcota bacterium]|nr:4-hydroxy-3-methylbut-2-enyl diphosphate reductase [Myxococcales bacterium]